MTRIKVLEAIAGSDFAWSPGDLIDLPDQEAATWADGHRAVLADGQEHGDPATSVLHQQPYVAGEDGRVLEVLTATLEEIEAPAGVGSGTQWVQWSVTVRLPAPDGTAGGQGPEAPAEPADIDDQEPVVPFDPSEHSNRQVLAYLDTVGEQEAIRVLDEEAAGENRAGIRKNRDAVLEAARLRDPVPRREPGAEVAADDSRGGGRGGQPETRDW